MPAPGASAWRELLYLDGKLVACDGAGVPHFYALHFHSRKYGRAARAGVIERELGLTLLISRSRSRNGSK